MSRQLEFDVGAEAPPSSPEAGPGLSSFLGTVVFGWAPVWVPLFLGTQLLFFGLLPTRREEARLDRAAAGVRTRMEALAEEERGLQLELEMLEDPIYRERVRRSLLDPEVPPLTLARARRIAGW